MIVVVYLLVLSVRLSAQDTDFIDAAKLPLKIARAVRISTPPVIDGDISDAVWQEAQPVTDLLQVEPQNLAPPTEITEVRILYDDENLYVAFRNSDSRPDQIMKRLARRDDWMEAANENADWIGIALDSQNDNRTGYVFIVNAAGVKMDLYIPDDENYDGSWDPVWDAQVASDEAGWSVEFELPFSIFQFSSVSELTWGLELNRMIYRKQEWHEWPGKARGVKGIVSRYGILEGLSDIPPPKKIEALPYVLRGRLTGDESSLKKNIGLDLKYGFTSNTTATLTINPDFGQVEADPSVLNLTAFETFYPEKRPFFVEGGSFFTPQTGEEVQSWQEGWHMIAPIRLFHSRRIGKAPGYFALSEGSLRSSPEATTILGAAKIVGKLPSGFAYGLIESFTDEEVGTKANGEEFLLEPYSNYFIGRVENPIFNRVSTIGAMVTDVRREKGESASTAAIDWRWKFIDNQLTFAGQAAASRTGQKEGYATQIRFAYNDPKWWNVDLIGTWYGDGFDINDMGFLQRVGVWAVRAGGGLRKQDPWGPFQHNSLRIAFFNYSRTDGISLARRIEINQFNMLKSFWGFGFGGQFLLPSNNDGDIFKHEDAWIIQRPGGYRFYVFFNTDPRKRIVFKGSLFGGRRTTASWGNVQQFSLTVNPTDYLRLSVGMMHWSDLNYEQYVGVTKDSSGIHRIYSPFKQELTDITVRLNWTFSPDLSLQMYLQPFRVTGHHYDFKELLQPRTLDLVPYDGYVYDPSFELRNNIGTFVLRWEYLPGSTLFVVYNLNDSNYRLQSENDWFTSKFNTLFIKLNYWFQT